MSKVGWALVAVLAATQLAFAVELMELSSLMRRVQSIDEKTAMMKNEAAVKALETERIRNTYYRVVMNNGPFALSEETMREIIQAGVKEAAEK